jgi:hypothetical protein
MGKFSEELNESSEGEPLDRAHELSWALLDDHISDENFAELENLLLNDPTARESYIRCAQLHAELATFFAPPGPAPGKASSSTPILGFLAEGFPQFGSPAAGDATK